MSSGPVEAVGAFALVVPFALGLASAPAEPRGEELFRFADREIVESSGLVVDGSLATGALVATVNDSGDAARVFTVDPASGETVGTTTFTTPAGDDPEDVEALAPAGAGRVWVADIGDNPGRRDELFLHEVPVGRGDLEADGEPLQVRYPDGAQDAESLVRHPVTGRLAVITKDVLGGTVQVLPAGAGPGDEVVTEPAGRVLGLATDAAFWPDGRHLLVRGYGSARAYTWPDLEPVGDLPLPRQRQGEGLAVDAGGRVLVSSEGLRRPVLEVAVPSDLRAVLEGRRSPDAEEGAGGAAADGDGDQALPARRPWPWAAGLLVAALVGHAVLRSRRRRRARP